MRKIFLLLFDTGDYEDRESVPVKAFVDETKVQALRDSLNNKLAEKNLYLQGDEDNAVIFSGTNAMALEKELKDIYSIDVRIYSTGGYFSVTHIQLDES